MRHDLMTKNLIFFLTSGLLGVALLLPGCGGTDDTPTTPGSELEVQWPDTSGQPLERLAITGLTDNAGNYHLEIVDADGNVVGGSPVLDDGGDYLFVMPFHPEGSAEGGPVEMRIATSQKTSPLVSINIEPLPATTHTVTELVELLRTNLDLRARLMGTTVDNLVAQQWSTMDEQHIPLRVLWSVLDDPDNPNRLSELAAGRAPAVDDQPLNLEFLERTLGITGLGPALVSDNSQLQTQLDQLALPDKSEIDSVEQLAEAMVRARSSATRLDQNSAVQQVNRDLASAMAILGFIPHPAAQLASAGVGALQFAYSTARQGMANLLPSVFVEMAFDVSHPFFNEDSEETGTWSNVRVIATSLGWQLDTTIVNGLLTLGGVSSAYSGWMNRFGAITGEAWITTLRDVLVNQNLQQLAALGDGQIFEIDPELFGPIDVTGMPWTQGFILTEVLSIPMDLQYIPLRVGSDQLEIRTGDGIFGGAYVEVEQTIEVRGIEVDLDPHGEHVQTPGELLTFRATVTNAEDPGLFWNIAPATWSSEPAEISPGVEEATIVTPTDENEYPFQITVTSTASGGLRASSSEQRFDAAVISTGSELVVEPALVCLTPGETQTFTAFLQGETTSDVTWSVESGEGNIGATSGIYVPPATGQGEAIVAATSNQNNQLQATATARYGQCGCYWQALVGGTQLEGVEAVFPPGEVSINLFPAAGVLLPALQFTATDFITGPGVFNAITIFFAQDGGLWVSGQVDGGDSSVNLIINSVTETYVDGSFSGYVVFPDDELTQMNISGSFRAAVYSGSGPIPCSGL